MMALCRISMGMIEALRPESVLCLGYPDLPDGGDTVAWLRKQGAKTVDCVDVIAHRGFERIVDLNEAQDWPRQYALVINPGTLEHCFNIGVAWANSWAAVAVGGAVLHIAPATMNNHGYWNINRVAMIDWCQANGGSLERSCYAVSGTGELVMPTRIKTSASGRGALPAETVLYAVLRKNEAVPVRWPAQAVYR
jgi:hypothetical protein